MKQPRSHPSALEHFSTGAGVVLLVGIASWFLHHHGLLQHLEMINLDVFFLSQSKPADAGTMAVVPITDDDYRDKHLFGGKSPLDPATVQKLMTACAVSGARIIAVDLDTSDWEPQVRQKAGQTVWDASPNHIARLVWAVGGWVDEKSVPHLDSLSGLEPPACKGVPASIPDQYGVVRGYLPAIEVSDAAGKRIVPNMALAIDWIAKNPDKGCIPENAVAPGGEDAMHYVNYAGGGASFPHPSAATVIKAAETGPWRNSNPLQGRIVLIGGSYRAGRDRYFTPAGYLNGVDILALTVLSMDKHVLAPTAEIFLIIDLLLGFSLLTATWFFQRTWVLLLSFLLIPVIALLTSLAVFRTSGYFFSVVPIVCGVFFHHLVEHAMDHRRLTKEVRKLRQDGTHPV